MPDGTGLAYRWVDARAARNYMRHDAMIGRTRHWLPKDVTGLDKIYPKRGLSFAMRFGQWMDVMLPVGFAIDPDAVGNLVARIDGHQIYLFSDLMDLLKSGVACRDSTMRQRAHAIAESLRDPDEAFVIGDIRDLSGKIREVVVRDEPSYDLMRPWCETNGISLRSCR